MGAMGCAKADPYMGAIYRTPYNNLQIAEGREAVGDNFRLVVAGLFGFQVAKLNQFVKNAADTFFDGFFVGLNHEFGMLRFLVGIVYTGEVLDFTFVYQFVEALDVALAADFDGAFDVDFDKIANFFACPIASFSVRSDSG